MSERGVFAIDRGVWDHPMLKSREPFSRREAWMWLISEAAWKPRVVMIEGRRIALERGQLVHSIRFMAEKWCWPKSNVARFLEALKTETMIGTESGTGITVITISKYNEYQRVSLPDRDSDGSDGGTEAGQERDREEDRKYKKKIGDGGDAQARDPDPLDRPEPAPEPALPARPASLITPEAHALAAELAAIAGVGAGADTPPGWCGAAHRVQTWLSRGWTRDVVLIGARASMARKRDGPPSGVGYFEPAIAREIAGQAKPLPEIVALPAKTVHAAPAVRAYSVRDQAEQETRNALAKLREFATGGGSRGAADPRCLPHDPGE